MGNKILVHRAIDRATVLWTGRGFHGNAKPLLRAPARETGG